MWKPNNCIPELSQKIKYRDQNSIIHVGIFHADTDSWTVCDIIGSIMTSWHNVIEWQGFEPALTDVWYSDWLLASIESELG
jgi:hypothetical protein